MASPIPELRERGQQAEQHGGAVRDMFGRIAPTYDLLNHLLSAGIDVSWRKQAIRELGEPRPGLRLLDSCAGTMDLTVLLAERFAGASIVASDFAAPMLDRGRAKAPKAEVVVADAMDMPFGDAEFDGVVCGFGMRNVADTAVGAREALRVLKPGAKFVTLEFFKPITRRARAFHTAYAKIVLPTVGGLVSGDRKAYAYLARSMDGFLTREEYEATLVGVGFTKVRGYDLLLGIASIVIGEAPR